MIRLLTPCIFAALLCASGNTPKKPTVVRFKENPIIRPDMLPGKEGVNINGPSLIRVPAWLPEPMGKYYLYFADHKGRYIRLAYSDRLEGPWKIYEPGTLTVNQVQQAAGYKEGGSHVASPDVHVDNEKREIRMYFHGRIGPAGTWDHRSGVALSKDGVHFKAEPKPIGDPYFRVFKWDGYYYAVTRVGSLVRSRDGLTRFEEGNPAFAEAAGLKAAKAANGSAVRHTAVKLDGDVLSVFFSRAGDTPECIMMSQVRLTGPWTAWRLSAPVKVLEPEMDYEGAKLPLKGSKGGYTKVPVHELRDPGVYTEGGKTYLLYSVSGESGIGIAELK